MSQFKRISHDVNIMGGKACIAGTRITVGMILSQLNDGLTTDELLIEYPHLTEADIEETLRWAGVVDIDY